MFYNKKLVRYSLNYVKPFNDKLYFFISQYEYYKKKNNKLGMHLAKTAIDNLKYKGQDILDNAERLIKLANAEAESDNTNSIVQCYYRSKSD